MCFVLCMEHGTGTLHEATVGFLWETNVQLFNNRTINKAVVGAQTDDTHPSSGFPPNHSPFSRALTIMSP